MASASSSEPRNRDDALRVFRVGPQRAGRIPEVRHRGRRRLPRSANDRPAARASRAMARTGGFEIHCARSSFSTSALPVHCGAPVRSLRSADSRAMPGAATRASTISRSRSPTACTMPPIAAIACERPGRVHVHRDRASREQGCRSRRRSPRPAHLTPTPSNSISCLRKLRGAADIRKPQLGACRRDDEQPARRAHRRRRP